MKRRLYINSLILLAFFLLGAQSALFAASVSQKCENLISDFMTLRMNLSFESESSEAIQKINKFKEDFDKERSEYSEEEQLVIDNFIVNEIYNYQYNHSESRKSTKAKNESYIAKHKGEQLDKWVSTTAADVISCYMSFSASDVLKYGLSLKDFYQNAVSQDEKMAYALMNLGQWYYWAPRLSGGSKKTALSYMEKALQAAKTPAETYYACIFLSQVLFEEGEKERCAKLLDQATEIAPQSTYLKAIRKMNREGDSLYQSNRKNSKMEGKPKD